MVVSEDESSGVVGISTKYKSIKVEGAGSSGANGTYNYGGMYYLEGYLNLKRRWYFKMGVWKGESNEFFLYQSEHNWCLTVDSGVDGAPTKVSPGFKGECLYVSTHNGKDLALSCGWICPPTSGCTISAGLDPPPRVAQQEEDPFPRTLAARRHNDESHAMRACNIRESSTEPKFLIDVEGAGTRGANGTYTYKGNLSVSGNNPWYAKSREWEGEQRNFFVSRFSHGWYISVGSDGASVPWTKGCVNGELLYHSPLANGDKLDFSSTNKWKNWSPKNDLSGNWPLPIVTVRNARYEKKPQPPQGISCIESLAQRGKKRRESSPSFGSTTSHETAAAAEWKKRKASTVVLDVMALDAAKKCRQVLAREKDRLRKDIEETEKRNREEEQRLERMRMDIEEMEKRKREEEQRLERLKREETEVSRELEEADDRLSKVERSKDVISIEE